MELSKYGHVVWRGQDEEAVRITVAFKGKQDKLYYCLKLRIPKNKLHSDYSDRTADMEPELTGDEGEE